MEKYKNPFYNNGLQFECTRCSYCCRYTPGYVFLSHNDLAILQQSFHVPESEFIEKYCRIVTMHDKIKLSFKEKENFDCIFFEKTGCAIYEYRPLQCQSYPFWDSNLDSHKSWTGLIASCPGIGKGTSHSACTIESWLRRIENENYDFSYMNTDHCS
jgi:Fe-S-cluster containining protein